jgi:hypothetical protein
MEWGERVTAAVAEKKQANSSGAREALAAAMWIEETMCRSLFYFCMRAVSSCGLVLQAQLAASDTRRSPVQYYYHICASERWLIIEPNCLAISQVKRAKLYNKCLIFIF